MPNEIAPLKWLKNVPGAEQYTFSIAATDATLALSGEPADAKATGDALAAKADSNGSYEGLTAGSAEQLLATTGAEDRAPYTQRQTGGGVSVGDRAVEKIVGGTIAWNQLNANDGSTATVKGVTYTKGDNGVWAITGTATGSDRKTISAVSVSQNHVFAIFPGASDSTLYGTSGSNVAAGKIALVILHGSDSSSQSFIGFGGAIIKKSSYTMTSLRAAQSATFVSGETGLTICPQLFDLTQMFGSAVADAVYAMEQATAGAGVAWFRAMFPESYYAYNAGELMSVQTSGKTVTSADGTVVKTYPLDSSLILRGVPRWDSAKGTMYYDGDEYTSDGRVTRRYGVRAYSSNDDAAIDVITDGTITVYELAESTEETATPYTGTQWVEAGGTEAFIDAGTETGRVAVPVGHDTFYPTDLRSKIERLPSDFSTLIAPTEATYTATRNYAVNALLIVDNILYQVTSAIATGGTITPGTNVQATTLAELIAALQQ